MGEQGRGEESLSSERIAAIVAMGDPAAIRALYRDYGSHLEETYGHDLATVPVLSRPETAPVVHEMLSDVEGRVLDAGCGPNPVMSIALGRDGRRVVGMDISEPIVRLARQVAALRGVMLLGVAGDLEALPFRTGAFDGIVCDDTIEHVPDDVAASGELSRVTASAGTAVLATPNRGSLRTLVKKAKHRLMGKHHPRSHYYAAASHLREYTAGELRKLVERKWVIRRWGHVGWHGKRRHRLASFLTATAVGRRFDQILVVQLSPRRADPSPGNGHAERP